MKSWSRHLFLPLLLVYVLSWAGCGKAGQELKEHPGGLSSPITVVETNRTLQNAPLYAAGEKGFLAKEKLKINLVTQSDYSKVAEDLRTGKIQILITTCDKLFYLHQQDYQDLVLLGQISTTNGYYLLSRKAGPFAWEDIKGKVLLGYQGGDWPFTLFYSLLRTNGLGPYASFHPVENLAYSIIPAAYRGGTGHYILAEEPLVSALESEGMGQIVPEVRLADGRLPAYTVMVNKEFLQKNRSACQGFMRALERGMSWLDQEAPTEIAATLKNYFPEYPEKVLQRAAGRYKNAGCWAGLLLDEKSLQVVQEQMLKEKELRQLIPNQQLLDMSLLVQE